uniref:Aquaporin-1 n=1 Tax=Myotis myotis TaxID=51298 RepID=A0A7J7V1Y4_MYOMY|nr:aquaporin 1 (Colton blood group) [Myotis myotis]
MSPAGPSHPFAVIPMIVAECPSPSPPMPGPCPRPPWPLGRYQGPAGASSTGVRGTRPGAHYQLCVPGAGPAPLGQARGDVVGSQSPPALLTEPRCPCPLQLASGVNAGQGLGIEIIATLQLVLCVLATTDRRRRDLGGSAPLAIGLSVALGHLLAIDYTGCSINPARSFGSSVISNNFKDHWVFWVGPFIGAALAVLIYDFILAPRSSDLTDRMKVCTSGQVEEYDLDGEDIHSRVEMKPK